MNTYTVVCKGCNHPTQVAHPSLTSADKAATISMDCSWCLKPLDGVDSMIIIYRVPKATPPPIPKPLKAQAIAHDRWFGPRG